MSDTYFTPSERDWDSTKADQEGDAIFTRQREEKMDKITNVKFEGIDMKDWPDMVDSYIVYAERGGIALAEEELEELNDDKETVRELLDDYLH